jgi:3-isopropylmalate dehydrogenase
MLASASIGEGGSIEGLNHENGRGMYEPIHGSAPDIAGRDIANPIAAILSVAMMLKFSFDMEDASLEIEAAVEAVLADGLRTADLFEVGTTKAGCTEMGDAILSKLAG